MSYVIISGASSGIGEAFASNLAQQGANLILVARRETRLQQIQQQLQHQYGVDVITVCCDLSTSQGIDKVTDCALHHNISGLINNAGFALGGKFEDIELDQQLNMIDVNVKQLVCLTYAIIPQLKKHNGFIINVASIGAFMAGPHMAIYYATKAFVLNFSQSLTEELKPDGIRVSSLCPGAIDSEFSQVAKISEKLFFKQGLMSCDEVAQKGLGQLNQSVVIPGYQNKVFVWAARFFPSWLTRKLVGWLQQ